MTKAQRCYNLIKLSQMHWRYSRGCKKAVWHKHMQKECQQQAAALQDELRRESRVKQSGWLPYKD